MKWMNGGDEKLRDGACRRRPPIMPILRGDESDRLEPSARCE
jgi:hypothetical protein